jgi:hypothetical protein
MAIQIHNWNNKSGTCVIEQNCTEFEFNLYAYGTCNCFLTAVYEYTDTETGETMEQLQWFFMDERHGKIMLGLQKGSDGKKENYMDEVRKITLYKNKCTDWKKIMSMFAEAFDHIDIEIRSDAE